MADTDTLVLRELDKIHKSIDKLDQTLQSHNGRLRKVEEAQAFLRGAKEAVGWRVPLFSTITSGLIVGGVLKFWG